jgi:predicted RNA-binding protein with PUA-like domain
MAPRKQYWLMKSEPDVFSFDYLRMEKKRTTLWEGVRNYTARNFMRNDLGVGDGILYYHSNAKPPGIAGLAEVASEAYADPTQFDPQDGHFDPKSKREDPRWSGVDIRAVERLPVFVSLEELRADARLADMVVLARGNRLSITPVTTAEWKRIRTLGGLK